MNPAADIAPSHLERRARRMRQCRQLAEWGMELARAAADEALDRLDRTGPSDLDPAEPIERFISHAHDVRQAILLERWIADGGGEPPPDHAGAASCLDDELIEDDPAGEAYRTVPDILAGIRAAPGLDTPGHTPAPQN